MNFRSWLNTLKKKVILKIGSLHRLKISLITDGIFHRGADGAQRTLPLLKWILTFQKAVSC
ncbi:hypothetical protein CS542_08930 [Pedobacter sp. IW39]|nr:hypothetical protein CS542_08930 [Pedobacter sp. IW39]